MFSACSKQAANGTVNGNIPDAIADALLAFAQTTKSYRTIMALLMSIITPRLEITGNQKFLSSQTRHAANRLLLSHTLPKQALPQSGLR